jgi:hypothetical protein
LWSWYPEIFHVDQGPTIFLAIAVPCLTTIATAAVLSYLVERGGPHAGQRFTWLAVVKGSQATESNGGKDS